jgi:hypothetical protein
MSDIYLYGKKIESVYELLGVKENDITYSIGWALAQSKEFSSALVNKIIPDVKKIPLIEIRLQENKKAAGITDIEICSDPNFRIIIEAKKGWSLPDKDQLKKYIMRLKESNCRYKALIAMSGCSKEYAEQLLRKPIWKMPVQHMSWKEVEDLLHNLKGTHAEKRLISELRAYLRRIIKMQDQNSNKVYVVSLGAGIPKGSKISWRDIVNKKRKYFHPSNGSGWPKEPPNYLGFRYDGKLQSIHHVENCKIVEELRSSIPEITSKHKERLFLYELGPSIKPFKEVLTGKIYANGRVWAMLDLLLTSSTIAKARDLTKKRKG